MGFDELVGGGGRPGFLAGVGVATLGIGATAVVSGCALAAATNSSDPGTIKRALALEHAGIAAYQIAGKNRVFSRRTPKVTPNFMGHHQQ